VTAVLAAAALSSLAAPSSVEAGPRDRPRTTVAERVRYGDLDLDTVAGARTMYRRIKTAVSRACALSNTPVLQTAPAEVRRCRSQAITRAVGKLDAPLVTAEHSRFYLEPPTVTAQR
jgi:UrcA family protein